MAENNETPCNICPRKCQAVRTEHKGYCGADETILISRAAPHMWEEPCISGTKGSGTVFFSGCNLHCVFCQNKAISGGGTGKAVDIDGLARVFLELQAKKVYNINLVTPTHYSLKIREAVKKAREKGLILPVVFNCGGYEDQETVRKLEDVVDIWMPDFKYMSKETSARYSHCPDYFEVAVKALDEMVRQIKEKGGAEFDNEGIMKRGVLVRHMMIPEHTGESKRILRFLHERYGDDIYISIMSQYTPMPHILADDTYPELHQKVDMADYERLVDFAVKIGIENAFIQEEDVAAESFIPAFDCTDQPAVERRREGNTYYTRESEKATAMDRNKKKERRCRR